MNFMDLMGSLGARFKDSKQKKLASLRRSEGATLLKKLKYLRINDPEIRGMVQPFLVTGEKYLELAAQADSWDPLAQAALEECWETLKVHLTEADESSQEKRFSLPDQNPFPQARERVLADLDRQLKILQTRTNEYTQGSGHDTLAAREELL